MVKAMMVKVMMRMMVEEMVKEATRWTWRPSRRWMELLGRWQEAP